MQLLLCLLSFVAYSTAQLPELTWSSCYLSNTQPSNAAASANFLERSLNRNHWEQTMDSFEEHTFGQKRQAIGTLAECAWARLPLVYSNDPAMNGTVHEDASAIQYIEVKVARFRKASGDSPLAVWHFAGGPGQDSVEVFGKYLETFSNAYDADVYTMNLRGISGSDSTSINFWDAMTPAQLKNQYSYISNHTQQLMPHFTTDNNCRDLKRVIDTIYESIPKQQIVLAGHSYGTYYVHRFVQMFPSVATRAVLDSTCAGPKGTIIDMNIWANVHWFPSLITKCEQDDFCNRVFDGQPKKVLTDALASNNTCGGFSASDAFKFTAVWALNQPTNFQITFAILKRFSRCNSGDATALGTISTMFNFEQLVENWKTKEPITEDLNAAVMYQMRGSELGRIPTPTPEQLAADMEQGPFGNFFPSPTDSIYACRRTTYLPWSATSPWANHWAPSNFTKFYLISGEIDFNTPYFLTEDFMANVPNSKLFIVPAAGHTAGLGTKCGFLVLQEYIKNGGDADSCGIPNISFQVSDELSRALNFYDWYGPVSLSNLAIGLIVGACLVVVAIIGIFVGVRMCKKKRSDEARLPLIH